MSDAEFEKITNRAGSGAPNFTYGLNSGGSDSGLAGFAYTASGTEPSSPANGDVWFDTANDKYYTYINGEFKQLTHVNAATLVDGGDRGIYAGGDTVATIDYYAISTLGNAADFGDLVDEAKYAAAASDGTRGFVMGGISSGSTYNAHIDVITIGTTGNATDHGDLVNDMKYGAGNCDGTYVVVAIGDRQASIVNDVDRFTAATASNATDHGNLTIARSYMGGQITDGTWGLVYGGMNGGSRYRDIEYLVLATTGNATVFGDVNNSTYYMCGTSNNVRGVIHRTTSGGVSNVLEYVTINTTGDAADFGDLTRTHNNLAACANLAGRAVFMGGYFASSPYKSDTMDYVDINTLGNAADFGNLTAINREGSGFSGD